MPSGWLGLDWGNVPAWFGATITSGSLLVAANAYRRNVIDKEREQAGKIAAWISIVDESGAQQRSLRIRNSSDAPVFDLRVALADGSSVELPELLPETTWNHKLGELDPAEASGKHPSVQKTVIHLEYPFSVSLSREKVLVDPSPSLQFRDAVGRWWQRDNRGHLSQIRDRVHATIYGVRIFGLRVIWRSGDQSVDIDVERTGWLSFPFALLRLRKRERSSGNGEAVSQSTPDKPINEG